MADSTKAAAEAAFAIAFGCFIVLDAYLVPASLVPNAAQRVVIDFLSTVGLFTLVFYAILKLYDDYLYRIIERSHDIGGEWHQLMLIDGPQPIAQRIRLGVCQIESRPDDISIAGISNRLDGLFSSNWQSEMVNLHHRELIVVYHSEGVNRGANKRRGGYKELTIEGHPGKAPTKIVGTWSDVYPAQNSGWIELYRSEEERDKRRDALLNMRGLERGPAGEGNLPTPTGVS